MSLDPSLRQHIAESVDAGFDAQVAFTQELVRRPSTRGNEHSVQDFMARALRQRGMDVDVFAMDGEAIARHPGGSRISETHSKAPIVVLCQNTSAPSGACSLSHGSACRDA